MTFPAKAGILLGFVDAVAAGTFDENTLASALTVIREGISAPHSLLQDLCHVAAHRVRDRGVLRDDVRLSVTQIGAFVNMRQTPVLMAKMPAEYLEGVFIPGIKRVPDIGHWRTGFADRAIEFVRKSYKKIGKYQELRFSAGDEFEKVKILWRLVFQNHFGAIPFVDVSEYIDQLVAELSLHLPSRSSIPAIAQSAKRDLSLCVMSMLQQVVFELDTNQRCQVAWHLNDATGFLGLGLRSDDPTGTFRMMSALVSSSIDAKTAFAQPPSSPVVEEHMAARRGPDGTLKLYLLPTA